MKARPTGPAPTTATVSPGFTRPYCTDLEPGREDVGEQQRRVVGHPLGQPVEGVVGEGDPDQLRLRAVDEVPEDPADARGAMLVKLVAQHKLLVEQFVTHRFALDDVVAAYETFGNAAHSQALKVLMRRWPRSLVLGASLLDRCARSPSVSDRRHTAEDRLARD